ncbi:MAG TPA: hypothetical protein P5026_11280 [Kiritimatiellia bacterium]|nr:hypothetical protein [Kiritimatiellia bacterium]HRU71446.1 hypothetical protein [Kiritimatiellia bacterium]
MFTKVSAHSQSADYTPGRALRFYVPLVLQAVSQSLTYPLVAAIVSHGANGVVDLAAFAQGQAVMFVILAFGGGMLTTGMVFGRDREGYQAFRRLNDLLCIALVSVQALVCMPPFDGIVFRLVLGLTSPLDTIARDVLMWSIPMQVLVFIRNAPLVALYNARASTAVNLTTIFRIGLTLLLVPLFLRLGWTGHRMGVLAITAPIAVETAIAYLLARPWVCALKPAEHHTASLKEQFLFNTPLSFGVVLLAVSGFMVGAFISRAADPERMLPIHYVTMGVVNPVGFAALRMQAVVLSFPPRARNDHAVFWFGLATGVILSLFPLAGQIPAVAAWYFGGVQNLPDMDIPLAKRAMLLVTILPILQSMRGHAEGLAAWRKRPNAILAGQAMFLASLVCTLFVGWNLGVPGYLMGVGAILVAVLMTLLTIRVGLVWADMEEAFGRPPRMRELEG